MQKVKWRVCHLHWWIAMIHTVVASDAFNYFAADRCYDNVENGNELKNNKSVNAVSRHLLEIEYLLKN
eukprot:g57352.t1